MKKFDIHRWWIPGKSMSTVFVPLGIWTFVYFVASWFRFTSRMEEAFGRLGWSPVRGWSHGITTELKMPVFNRIINGCFSGYWIILLACLIIILERYMWLKRDRSLYIMKRLPAAETFRRCALLLLIYAAVVLVLTFAMLPLCKSFYMANTPKVLLEPQGPIKFFNALSINGRNHYILFDF